MSIRIPIRSETSTSAHPTRTVKRVATRTSPISCLGNNLPRPSFRRPNRLFPAPALHPLQMGDLRAPANAGLLPVEVQIVMATRALSAGLVGPPNRSQPVPPESEPGRGAPQEFRSACRGPSPAREPCRCTVADREVDVFRDGRWERHRLMPETVRPSLLSCDAPALRQAIAGVFPG